MLTQDDGLPPLLCRSQLKPGESLFSLLIRLAEFNLYKSSAILDQLCVVDLPDTQAGHPTQTTTFERLSRLTLIDPSQLYRATVHRFAPLLIPPDVEMPTLTLPGGVTMPRLSQTIRHWRTRPVSATQFCPACLRESGYHRLIWMAEAASLCLHHQCLLLNGCPGCHQPLHIRDIVDRQCQCCKTDLRGVSAVEVKHDPFGFSVQQVIQTWLTGTETFHPDQWGLPDHPPAVLFQVLEGIRSTVMKVEADWEYLHQPDLALPDQILPLKQTKRLSPGAVHRFYTTAFKALINWPVGFYEFLQAYRGRDEEQLCRGLHVDFHHLYPSWLQKRWNHPTFQFVQDAFDQYLVDHYSRSNIITKSGRYRSNSALAREFTYIPVTEAARLFGKSSNYVQVLIQSGLLMAYPSQDYVRSPPFLEREAVLNFRRQTQFISLENTAQQLVLSPSAVITLGELGLLETECDPETGHQCFRQSSIAKLILDVAEYVFDVIMHSPPGPVIDLASAIKTLSQFGISPAHLIQRVVQGELPAYCYLNYPHELGDLLFIENDIKAWWHNLSQETRNETKP